MKALILNLALASSLLALPADNPGGQAFRLGPGEYRWIPFTVNAVPSEIQAHFEVLQGNPTVHAELLSMSDFRQFNRGRAHGALTATGDARVAQFHKLISARGQYAVVVANEKNGAPATVSLELHLDANPRAGTATELPAGKRLTIILLSFAFFVVTVGWSGRKLLRAIRAV